jgi:hypothetical protein
MAAKLTEMSVTVYSSSGLASLALPPPAPRPMAVKLYAGYACTVHATHRAWSPWKGGFSSPLARRPKSKRRERAHATAPLALLTSWANRPLSALASVTRCSLSRVRSDRGLASEAVAVDDTSWALGVTLVNRRRQLQRRSGRFTQRPLSIFGILRLGEPATNAAVRSARSTKGIKRHRQASADLSADPLESQSTLHSADRKTRWPRSSTPSSSRN